METKKCLLTEAVDRAYSYLFALGYFTTPTSEGAIVERLLVNAKVEIPELVNENEQLRKVKDELLVMLQKIYNINNVAFSLKNFDVNRLKKEIGAAIDNANKL